MYPKQISLEEYGKNILSESDKFHEAEIKKLHEIIEKIGAENARYREALKHISLEDDDLTDCCLKAIDKNYLYAHYHVIAEDALKGVSK